MELKNRVAGVYYLPFHQRVQNMKYLDIHAHIFPSNIAGKVIHQLETYYGCKWDGTGEPDDLLESLEAAGIDRSVIFSSATKPAQVPAIHNYIHSQMLLHLGSEFFVCFRGEVDPVCGKGKIP